MSAPRDPRRPARRRAAGVRPTSTAGPRTSPGCGRPRSRTPSRPGRPCTGPALLGVLWSNDHNAKRATPSGARQSVIRVWGGRHGMPGAVAGSPSSNTEGPFPPPMADETVDFERVTKVYREESSKKTLSRLEPDFYGKLAVYLKGLERKATEAVAKSPNSPQAMLLQDELRKVLKKRDQIFQYRERKIALLASLRASGGEADISGLATPEAELFDRLVGLLKQAREVAFGAAMAPAPGPATATPSPPPPRPRPRVPEARGAPEKDCPARPEGPRRRPRARGHPLVRGDRREVHAEEGGRRHAPPRDREGPHRPREGPDRPDSGRVSPGMDTPFLLALSRRRSQTHFESRSVSRRESASYRRLQIARPSAPRWRVTMNARLPVRRTCISRSRRDPIAPPANHKAISRASSWSPAATAFS